MEATHPIDELDAEQKIRRDWERAVVDELQYLDEKQVELDGKLSSLDGDTDPEQTEPETAPAIKSHSRIEGVKRDLSERIDAPAELVAKLQADCKSERGRVDTLDARVKMLEDENDKLIDKNAALTNKVNALERDFEADTRLSDLKTYLVKEVDRTAEECSKFVKRIEESFKLQRCMTADPANPSSDSSRKIKVDMPKFKGLPTERPMKFIEEWENYLTLVKPGVDKTLCVIAQSLQDDAYNWWYLQKGEVADYEAFVSRFKVRYWNTNVQRATRRKVEFGQYLPAGCMSRVNYAIYVFGLAKELELSFSEEGIVLKISEHFERAIRHAITGRQVKDKNSLLKILANFGTDDQRQKRDQPAVKSTTRVSSYSPSRQPSNTPAATARNHTWQSRHVQVARPEGENLKLQSASQTRGKGRKYEKANNKKSTNYNNIDVLDILDDKDNASNAQSGNGS